MGDFSGSFSKSCVKRSMPQSGLSVRRNEKRLLVSIEVQHLNSSAAAICPVEDHVEAVPT